MKPLYKSFALALGAAGMISSMTSCEDFLTRDPEDAYLLTEYVKDAKTLTEYTFQIYGPRCWNDYDDKFSWCVGEIYSGNVYHNYSDEGQFHFMDFNNTNSHIQNGFTGLYGVIARCNHIINELPSVCRDNHIAEADIKRAVGEAKMYRGMCYFMLAEYWGEVPIVLNNTGVITSDKAFEITKASRGSIYALVEKDWKEALEVLPEAPWGNKRERVYKASAAGMLAKLYVTMASCQSSDLKQNAIDNKQVMPYVCPDPAKYYQQAISYADSAISYCGDAMAQEYEGYESMFQADSYSDEILFGLRFERGEYGVGSSRQIQFARSKHLAHMDDAYGGEKGLTTMLFKNFAEGDIRKKACCYYNGHDDYSWTDAQTLADKTAGTGHYYILADGSKYYYFLNPNKTLTDDQRTYGNEPNSVVFNHCRKFVYSSPFSNKFSVALTIPFLRTADLHLLKAEAQMAIAANDATEKTSAGLAEINVVRDRAKARPLTEDVAFYTPDDLINKGEKIDDREVDDTEGNKVNISQNVNQDCYKFNYDLMSERRFEFALECLNWLDIKRLYYRNPDYATSYVKEQDRGFIYGEKYNLNRTPSCPADFERQAVIYNLSVEANKVNPTYSIQKKEMEIHYENLCWFLPIPSNVTTLSSEVKDFTKEIQDGTYPY